MIGSAPDAKIYAFRVFGSTAEPSKSSIILDAIDRIIELKTKENVDIRVANFSLGRRTIYAGLDDFDQEFEMLLAKGIVPVVSTGNAGPAFLTTASPASAFSAIAVGAGSLAHQDRITGDVGFFASRERGHTATIRSRANGVVQLTGTPRGRPSGTERQRKMSTSLRHLH